MTDLYANSSVCLLCTVMCMSTALNGMLKENLEVLSYSLESIA